MGKICAKFKITTPMFLGGADFKQMAELRPTSVKGVMRFWFRAVNYGKYQGYEEVKKIENELFGSTTSQSRFFLKLNPERIKEESYDMVRASLNELFSEKELAYLGYGLYQRTGRLYRAPGEIFTMELLLKPKLKNRLNYENLIKPIKALGLFGGLGSRSRRGFGSVTLDSIHVDDQEC